jgi:hypothetical protein
MTIKTYYSLVTPAGTNEQTGVGTVTVTATGATGREYPELGNYTSGLLMLDVTAVSGTATPTLTLSLQVNHRNSDKWETIASFPPQTAVTDSVIPIPSMLVALPGNKYRLSWVVSGTNPSFTFSCGIWAATEEAAP